MKLSRLFLSNFLLLGLLSLNSATIFAMGSPLPPGSYVSTCRSCHIKMQTGDLECFCKENNGTKNLTSLPNPSQCDNVENSNGYLRCLRWQDAPEPYNPPAPIPEHSPRKRLIEAGPIWNTYDAQEKCPSVCYKHHHRVWTGQWETTQFGRMSVCECKKPRRHHRHPLGMLVN